MCACPLSEHGLIVNSHESEREREREQAQAIASVMVRLTVDSWHAQLHMMNCML